MIALMRQLPSMDSIQLTVLRKGARHDISIALRYRIHDGYLERLAWPLTDAAGSVKPTMQKLIPADSLRLQFYDGTRWQESWSSVQAIPVAVRMTLHSPQWGEIERIWLLRGPQ